MIKTTITDKAPTKVCTRCGEEKPLGEFWKDRCSEDGLRYYCKSCMNCLTNNWVAKNREKKKKYMREYSRKRHRIEGGELRDEYVVKIIHDLIGLSFAEIKSHPELIEAKRDTILCKRLIKQIKNELSKEGCATS